MQHYTSYRDRESRRSNCKRQRVANRRATKRLLLPFEQGKADTIVHSVPVIRQESEDLKTLELRLAQVELELADVPYEDCTNWKHFLRLPVVHYAGTYRLLIVSVLVVKLQDFRHVLHSFTIRRNLITVLDNGILPGIVCGKGQIQVIIE